MVEHLSRLGKVLSSVPSVRFEGEEKRMFKGEGGLSLTSLQARDVSVRSLSPHQQGVRGKEASCIVRKQA